MVERGEYITCIPAIKRDFLHTLELLEGDLYQREADHVAYHSRATYIAWQGAPQKLSVFKTEMTQKLLLNTAQRVFEYGDKNGRLLAWLARGKFAATHMGSDL